MKITLLFILLFVIYQPVSAASSKNMSAAGRKRMQQNVLILEQNLKDTEENITITQKNREVLQAELKDLESLEKEHGDLKGKFAKYLGEASQEMEKNDKAI